MSTRPGEHQGSGLAHYLWASSPLRRYSDLVNQRQLLATIDGAKPPYADNDAELFAALTDFEATYCDLRANSRTGWSTTGACAGCCRKRVTETTGDRHPRHACPVRSAAARRAACRDLPLAHGHARPDRDRPHRSRRRHVRVPIRGKEALPLIAAAGASLEAAARARGRGPRRDGRTAHSCRRASGRAKALRLRLDCNSFRASTICRADPPRARATGSPKRRGDAGAPGVDGSTLKTMLPGRPASADRHRSRKRAVPTAGVERTSPRNQGGDASGARPGMRLGPLTELRAMPLGILLRSSRLHRLRARRVDRAARGAARDPVPSRSI